MNFKLLFVLIFLFNQFGFAGGKTDVFLKFAQQNKDILTAQELIQVQWKMQAPEFKTSLYHLREKLAENANLKHQKSADQGVILHQAIELPAMTAGFLIANGFINFATLWESSGGNPTKFEDQLMAQKDPITHFSFYAFMLANGFWFDYRSKGMSPALRHANFRRMMYEGLAVGSFASTVVADIGAVFKECATPHKPDPKDIEKACNEALAKMFSNGKVQQYMSQIFTLLVVQSATDFSHKVTAGAMIYSKDQLWKALVYGGTKSKFLATGVRFAITFNPVTGPAGGIVVWGATVVGMLANFFNFVGIDHVTNVPINRLFTNALRPPFFVMANKDTIDCYLYWGDKYLWSQEKISQNFAECERFENGVQNLNPLNLLKSKKEAEINPTSAKFEKNILKELESFSTTMQDWRTHINSDVENYLNSWLKMTSRILSQVTISEKYYQKFSTDLSDALTKRHNITRPPGTKFYQKQAAIDNSNDFPFRKMPLFGINFDLWTDNNSKMEAEGKPALTKEQAPLMFPLRTTKEQSAFLKKYATEFFDKRLVELITINITTEENNNFIDLLNKLKDGDVEIQSKALSVFNYEFNSRSVQTQTIPYRKLVYKLMAEIGIFERKVLPGEAFNAAFELASKTEFGQADFDLAEVNTPAWNKLKYKNLSSPTEYLMSAMVCGENYGYLEEYWIWFWSPDFRPPTLLRTDAKPIEMCDTQQGSLKSYDFYSRKLTNPSTKKTYDGIVAYIAGNYNPKVLGDIFNDGVNVGVKDWFQAAVIPNVKRMLNTWDKKYQHIVTTFEGNLARRITEGEYETYTEFGEAYTQKWKEMNVAWYNQIIDKFRFPEVVKILGEDWVSSIRYERDLYLNLMQAIRYERKLNSQIAKSWSIFEDVKAIKQNQKPALLKSLRPEFESVQTKMEELLAIAILPPSEIKYLDYVKLRTQFQELFRDILYPAIQQELFRQYKPTGSVRKLSLDFLAPKLIPLNTLSGVKETAQRNEQSDETYSLIGELLTLAELLEYPSPNEFIKELNTSMANGMKAQVEFSNKVRDGLVAFVKKQADLKAKLLSKISSSPKNDEPKVSLNAMDTKRKIYDVASFIATMDGRQFIMFQLMLSKARSEKKFEDVFKAYESVIKDSLREKIVGKSISQLILLEAQITRAVKFKVLMQQGLSFTDADISTLGIPGSSQCPNGTKPGGGCK